MGIFFQGSTYEDENKSTSYQESTSRNDDYFSFDSDDDTSVDDFFSEATGEIAEKPSARPYDQMEISVPKSDEISADAWNKQLEQHRRSFKESVEIIKSIKPISY